MSELTDTITEIVRWHRYGELGRCADPECMWRGCRTTHAAHVAALISEALSPDIEKAAEAAYIAHELAIRGDGKCAPWQPNWPNHAKWRDVVQAAFASTGWAAE